MKFAYFSASPIMKHGLMTGFEKNGHDTKLYPMGCIGQSEGIRIEQDGKIFYVKPSQQDIIVPYIDKCIEEYKPDYVVLEGYQEELAIGIYYACKKYGCGFIFWNIEDPVGFKRLLPVCKIADYLFTTTVECIPKYQEHGLKAHLLTFGCDPDYHRTGKFNPNYDLDFAVQASWYNWPERVNGYNNILKPLMNLNLNYKIWGYNWDSDYNGRMFLENNYDKFSGTLDNSELPDLCASSKIILGFQCDSSSETQTSMRNYEVLSCNGFYLCQYTKASANIFKEGTHLELVRDKFEAVEKAEFYLKHEDARKRIARQGQEYVQKEHSYEKRVRDNILPYLNK